MNFLAFNLIKKSTRYGDKFKYTCGNDVKIVIKKKYKMQFMCIVSYIRRACLCNIVNISQIL